MNPRIISAVLSLTAIACTASRADTVTVSVAGVIVDQGNVRVGDVTVELVGGARLTSDPTRGNGVYVLTTSGIDDRIDQLLVIAKRQGFDDAAEVVELERTSGGIRRAKATDIVLYSNNTSNSNKKVAEERLSNVLRTEDLKVAFRLVEKSEAQKSVTSKAAEIAATLPDADIADWQQFAGRAFDNAKMTTPVLARQDVLKLPAAGDFQEKVTHERARVNNERRDIGKLLENRTTLPQESLDKLLSIPPSNIPDSWLTLPAMKSHLNSINQEYRRSGKIDAKWTGADEIKPWLEGSDLKKQVLLLEQLKRAPSITDAQKVKLENRIEQLIPHVSRKY